jgi:hypothetical protein
MSCFLCRVETFYRVRLFAAELRNSCKDVRNSKAITNRVPRWKYQQIGCKPRGRSGPSWYTGKYGRHSDAIVCPGEVAFSIMQDYLHFQKFVLGVCCIIESRAQNDMNGTGNGTVSSLPGWGRKRNQQILTSDESWVLHFQTEPKRASMQWKHPGSLVNQYVWSCVIGGKGCADFLWLSRCTACSFSKICRIRQWHLLSSSADTCRFCSQKTTRPTKQRITDHTETCQMSSSPWNPRKNSGTQVGPY